MHFVEVQFKTQVMYHRMTTFYNATSTVPAPYLECLFRSAEVPAYSPAKKMIVRSSPVGVTRKPRDTVELLTAIRQIFGCIFHLHDLRYVHCDIRWSNIINYNGDWDLIDCEYTCHLDEMELLATRSKTMNRKAFFVLDENRPWDPGMNSLISTKWAC
jgi:hypothetical protein